MTTVKPAALALQCLLHWERSTPHRVALSQPLGDGTVRDFTWAQLGSEVRRMAAHLQSQGWEHSASVAILSKNCAWWLMSDLAIWMAGYVSVALYPTLAASTVAQILVHSDARACFIGKLDGWAQMRPGLPAGLPCISYPLSPPEFTATALPHNRWDAICARTAPLPFSVEGEGLRGADELAALIYTSGTTGAPKGVMHSFGNFAWAMDAALQRVPMTADDRMLSYLPLAHVVERVLVEHGWLRSGFRVYFADTLDTFAADMQRASDHLFLSPALVGEIPARCAPQTVTGPAQPAAGDPGGGHAGAAQADAGAGPGPMPLRRWWRSADADGAAGLVPPPRPAPERGLRHEREPGGVAPHRGRPEPGRLGGAALPRRASANRCANR